MGSAKLVTDATGYTPEQICEAHYNELTLAQVHAALSYYYDHQPEIDAELQQNTEAHWRART